MQTPNNKSPRETYLEKLRQAQFKEQRELKRNTKLTPEQKIRAKRQIVVKYKNLRRSTDFVQK